MESADDIVKTRIRSKETDQVNTCALESDVCMEIEEENFEGQMECFRAVCELLEDLIRVNDCHQVGQDSGYYFIPVN